MGKKTTVEKINKRITQSKIFKFSYVQTLSIDGGLTSVDKLGGTTAGGVTTGTASEEEKTRAQKGADAVNKSYFLGGKDPAAQIGKSLFGKKKNVDTKFTAKESGWTVVNTWNQPQFDIIRYAIGIRDLTIAKFSYEPVSEVISNPWKSPKEITKVILNVDQFIPSVFPPGDYIEYYIKPNMDNTDWIRINPLGTPSVFKEDGNIVPRIINFNTEKPLSSRLEDAFFTTPAPVKEVIFRAVLKRPDNLEGTTVEADGYSPVLRSYRLSMIPKNGL